MITSYWKSALTFHLSSSTISLNILYITVNKRNGFATVLIISRWAVIDNSFVYVWGWEHSCDCMYMSRWFVCNILDPRTFWFKLHNFFFLKQCIQHFVSPKHLSCSFSIISWSVLDLDSQCYRASSRLGKRP